MTTETENTKEKQLGKAESDAIVRSLAENVVHENMHPADQFMAFRTLLDKVVPFADIDAPFGVAAPVALQHQKPSRLSPVILAAYRDESLNLEQVTAFAISDDHELQEHVLVNLHPDNTGARTIRDAMVEEWQSPTRPRRRRSRR